MNIQELKKYIESKDFKLSDCNFSINSLDFSRDINGNRTAKFICRASFGVGKAWESVELCRSKRREQFGYTGLHGSAVYKLEKLGFTVDSVLQVSDNSAYFTVLEN